MSVTIIRDGAPVTLSDGDWADSNVVYTPAELWQVVTDTIEARRLVSLAAFMFGLDAIPLDDAWLTLIQRLRNGVERSAIGYWNYVKADGSHDGAWNEGDGVPLQFRKGDGTYVEITPANAVLLDDAAFLWERDSGITASGKQADNDAGLVLAGSDEAAGRAAMLAVITDIDTDWPT